MAMHCTKTGDAGRCCILYVAHATHKSPKAGAAFDKAELVGAGVVPRYRVQTCAALLAFSPFYRSSLAVWIE